VDSRSGRTILGNPGANLPILYVTTPTDDMAAFVAGGGADTLFGVAEHVVAQQLSQSSF